MKRLFGLILVGVLGGWPIVAPAQTLIPIPVTPDLAVAASSTAEYIFDQVTGRRAEWISIKNDCASDLGFAINPADGTTNDYSIRLKQGESFTAHFQTFALGASNDTATACTFTLAIGRNR